MKEHEYDVVVVGAGGDGPVAAWRLGQLGLDVLVLEAGPFYGNENWEHPHEDPGAESVSSKEGLSGELLDEQFTTREFEMTLKLLWGPADHERGYWFRKFPGSGATLQASGVGGTTLIYTGNHPRAFPAAIDEQGHWPIDYEDLLPYYRRMEDLLDVQPAPVTSKEELFFQGAENVDPSLLGGEEATLVDSKNVDEVGYRPQPNAIWGPDDRIHVDEDYDGDFHYDSDAEDPIRGHTMATTEIAGNPHPIGAPYEEKAKRTSAIGVVPRALGTGNVTIRPNAFVTNVLVDASAAGDLEATGVTFRDTWSGDREKVLADTVVLAAGAIETPRLWFNSGLPNDDGWVGKGMTLHFGDNVMGFWEEDVLEDRVGKDTVDPHEGQTIAARFDYPGVGMLQTTGSYPGIAAILGFGASQSGFTFTNEADGPWDSVGRLAGSQLKSFLSQYRQALPILVVTDDRPHKRNGISVAPGLQDEHGPVPLVNYVPSKGDIERRDRLAEIAADILEKAGADHIHRSDSPPTALHIHSTMAMGKVVDEGCEAYDVGRLFVADHSALANGVGGPNPTNTGQSLALRTAEFIADRYFGGVSDPIGDV